MSSSRIPVAVLGATGLVGQRLLSLLIEHPWFEVTELIASERSGGKLYADAARWKLTSPLPPRLAAMRVAASDPEDVDARVVFSAIDKQAALELEPALAERGHIVVTNASAHRMHAGVPLVVPEINAAHLDLVRDTVSQGRGAIVANPNCSTIGLVLALAPLHQAVGLERVVVTTLQAVSGAGYPGVPSIDVMDNVVPGIPGEEEKIESEPMKIFGALAGGNIAPASFKVSSHTHRVPVQDGHLMAISVQTREPIEPGRVREIMSQFRGEPQRLELPSAPSQPIVVLDEEDRPQPRLDRDCGGGMSVVVGRIRPCPALGVRFEALSHNTARGAAGGTLLIAELMAADGLIGEGPRG